MASYRIVQIVRNTEICFFGYAIEKDGWFGRKVYYDPYDRKWHSRLYANSKMSLVDAEWNLKLLKEGYPEVKSIPKMPPVKDPK